MNLLISQAVPNKCIIKTFKYLGGSWCQVPGCIFQTAGQNLTGQNTYHRGAYKPPKNLIFSTMYFYMNVATHVLRTNSKTCIDNSTINLAPKPTQL